MTTSWSGPQEWAFRLGKRPATPGATKFALINYFNLDLPVPPAYWRHADPPKWHDYGNMKAGNCVFASSANQARLIEHEGGLPVPEFTEDEVIATYSRVTGYNPKKPETDDGTNVKDGLSYIRKKGIKDVNGHPHKIDAYAWVQLHNMKYFKAALWMLGTVGIGFMFPDYGMDDFKAGKVWEVKDGFVVGGHYVPCIGIAPNGNLICVSWGREVEMTQEFYLENADEVIGIIDIDRINKATKVTPEGFNEQRLRHDLRAIAKGRLYALSQTPTDWA